jgi:RNA polymerase sigma factor (sigma-70 family)
MLKPWTVSSSHEDIVLEYYERMKGWSLQLTQHDASKAEDLVHDCLVQFILVRPDFRKIENLEGYLYTMLHNRHLSLIRRSARNPIEPLPVLEYDSAELGIRSVDPRTRMSACEELNRICHYACVRKETSKAGSVLILRFFHDYFPIEIARILKCDRQVVNNWIRIARAEARSYLKDPRALQFLGKAPMDPPPMPPSFLGSEEFLKHLQQSIFKSRRHECFPVRNLEALYRPGDSSSIDCGLLAHWVSCARCLEELNRILDLPQLSDRASSGKLGAAPPDSGKKIVSIGSLKNLFRGSREVFHHAPQRLYIFVNGFPVGAHLINAKFNEFAMNINLDEKIGFVEVFSEQGVLLLTLDVMKPPPEGEAKQSTQVELSESRSLELSLDFSETWPVLRLTYQDPLFQSDEAAISVADLEEAVPMIIAQVGSPSLNHPDRRGGLLIDSFQTSHPVSQESATSQSQAPVTTARTPALRSSFAWFRRQFTGKQKASGLGLSGPTAEAARRRGWMTPLLHPVPLSIFLMCVILAAVIFKLRGPMITAADLLRESTAAEENILHQAGQAVHRTILLEEKKPSGEVLARRRIEIWQMGETGQSARRVYDEQNHLIAGEWARKDGSAILYAKGAALQQISSVHTHLSFEQIWQWEPSARDLTKLLDGSSAGLTIQESASRYIIHYQAASLSANRWRGTSSDLSLVGTILLDAPKNASFQEQFQEDVRLLEATLVLSRPDLHSIELTLLVQPSSSNVAPTSAKTPADLRPVLLHFKETAYEQHSASSVPAALFEPDPELLAQVPAKLAPAISKGAEKPSIVASPDLEVEVLSLIDQTGAGLDDQFSVAREASGKLRVEGIVETDDRKDEILRGLDPVSRNPAVEIHIATASDVLTEEAKAGQPAGPLRLEHVQPAAEHLAVEAELRRYFLKTMPAEQVDEAINRFANEMLTRSRLSLHHAWAVNQLVDRFSPDELRGLSLAGRERWLAMIHRHAEALEKENIALRQELLPIFTFETPDFKTDKPAAILNDADLARAGKRLFELAFSNYNTVRSAFTLSTDTTSPSSIDKAQFWQSIAGVEEFSRRIQQATQVGKQ